MDENSVQITNCKVPPCQLIKGTFVGIQQKFSASRDVKNVTTLVGATLDDVRYPFDGVDETSACAKIYKADGKTFNGCPLKKNEEYVYKNRFPILNWVPSVGIF